MPPIEDVVVDARHRTGDPIRMPEVPAWIHFVFFMSENCRRAEPHAAPARAEVISSSPGDLAPISLDLLLLLGRLGRHAMSCGDGDLFLQHRGLATAAGDRDQGDGDIRHRLGGVASAAQRSQETRAKTSGRRTWGRSPYACGAAASGGKVPRRSAGEERLGRGLRLGRPRRFVGLGRDFRPDKVERAVPRGRRRLGGGSGIRSAGRST